MKRRKVIMMALFAGSMYPDSAGSMISPKLLISSPKEKPKHRIANIRPTGNGSEPPPWIWLPFSVRRGCSPSARGMAQAGCPAPALQHA